MSSEGDKKQHTANLANEADRIAVRKALEKAEKVYGSTTEQTENPDIQELVEQNEDLKAKLGIIAERALEEKMNKLNIPETEREDFRKDPSMLRGYERAILENKTQKQAPSGSAPLNDLQYHGSQGSEQGYASVEDMINDLKAKEKSGDISAKKTLDKLFAKVLSAQKQGTQIATYPSNPVEHSENEKGTIERVISPLTVENEDESEIAKFGVKKDSHRRKQKGKEELERRQKGE